MLVSLTLFAQVNWDTIYIRHTKLQARDWLYCLSFMQGADDSAVINYMKFIGGKVKQAVPNVGQNPTTDVTIDSLRGDLIWFFYVKTQNISAGEGRVVGNRIYNEVRLKPQLQYLLGGSDNSFNDAYLRRVRLGKNLGYD